MHREQIKDIKSPFLSEALKIYEASFPVEERRSNELQIELLENELFNFDVIIEEGQCIGILFWWAIDNYRYIEYFAIHSKCRNTGIGKKIISEFIAESRIPVVLEVEKPKNDLTRRRIGFYERLGFELAEEEYAHPPLTPGKPFLELCLMTYPRVFTKDEIAKFIALTHPVVHRDYFEEW